MDALVDTIGKWYTLDGGTIVVVGLDDSLYIKSRTKNRGIPTIIRIGIGRFPDIIHDAIFDIWTREFYTCGECRIFEDFYLKIGISSRYPSSIVFGILNRDTIVSEGSSRSENNTGSK